MGQSNMVIFFRKGNRTTREKIAEGVIYFALGVGIGSLLMQFITLFCMTL